MKLDDIRQGIDALIFMERYVDEATQTYSTFAAESEVAPEYRPRSDRPSFDLVTVITPRERVSVFQAAPETGLLEHYIRPEGVLFAVHPETWSGATTEIDHLAEIHALPRGESIRVAPTASTRTVLALQPPGRVQPHFLKLHYPRRISRFNRRLRRKNIQNCIEISRDVEQVRCAGFAYLPDVLGFAYDGVDATRDDASNAWGFLVREAVPRPHQKRKFLIPFFALYGGDLKHGGHPALLLQLIERLGVSPESFVIDEVMIPVLRCWASVVRQRGILLESHAQNILLEIDEELRPPYRVVHRDFDVWVDPEVRRRGDLAPFSSASISEKPYPAQQFYSLIYDRFIGHELFDYLLALLKRWSTIDEQRIRRRVREAFHDIFPDSSDFFPANTMFYYSDKVLPENEFTLVDMQRPPEWR